jgi:ADP-heptose:LPS heptosyltransferase/glycosyltransferase involved in cell wall biosynthesis
MKVRKIVFEHKRALGDSIMFTAGVRDFKLLFPHIQINVSTNQPALWENNPYIDQTIKIGDEGVEYYKVGYPAIGNVNNATIHFTNMFLFDMIAVADLTKDLKMPLGEFCAAFANGTVGDPPLGDLDKHKDIAKEPFLSLRNKYNTFCEKFSRQRGDLHVNEKEKAYNLIQEIYGIEKYWVIAPGGKRDCTAKIWDWRKFQEVIDHYEGRIKFVMIGKSDLLVEKLNGVIDLTDKFNNDIRGLISLVYHSEGCVSGPSALLHMAAAVPPRHENERKPCVAIFGGREPTTWSWYCNFQVLHTNGAFYCCDNGGCWKSRVVPLPKDPEHNHNLCNHTVMDNGKTIQACMYSITAQDVIRAIEKYYDGDLYSYLKEPKKIGKEETPVSDIIEFNTSRDGDNKTINLLGNLNSSGGGEQSLCMIAKMLMDNGWKVNLYPWGSVHKNYQNLGLNIMPINYKEGRLEKIEPNLPLLFYANDCVWDFAKTAKELIDKCSSLIIGINYMNGPIPKTDWLAKCNKLKAIIFQNEEAKDNFERDAIGFDKVKKIVLYGAIDLDKYLEVCIDKRKDKEELVILKHCVPDYRKYVTKDSVGSGEKVHLWQKNLSKELDTKFYERLLKDTKNTRFEFMEAHEELVEHFKDEKRMVFHKWNSISVDKFLARGHVYLYRTSNMWKDNYPRVVAEALAAGLPILSEPRDGTKDRVDYGNTGFYCIDYDGYLYAIRLLQRKEDYRHKMGMYCKDWARQNLDPRRWVDLIEENAC